MQETRNEQSFNAECAYGAPDWSGGSGLWAPFQAGTEVTYTAALEPAQQPAGASAQNSSRGIGGGGSPSASHASTSTSSGSGQATSRGLGGRLPRPEQAAATLGAAWGSSTQLRLVCGEQDCPIELQVFAKPFSKGALRQAYYARCVARRLVCVCCTAHMCVPCLLCPMPCPCPVDWYGRPALTPASGVCTCRDAAGARFVLKRAILEASVFPVQWGCAPGCWLMACLPASLLQ